MKKIWIIVVLAFLLAGCTAGELETLQDVYAPIDPPQPQRMQVKLPEDAAVQSVHSDVGTIYFCDGYEIALQTLSSGDLNATFENLTGFSRDSLTVMQTQVSGMDRYECVWTSAGESGDQIGRTLILDDGNYHYCLWVMAPAEEAGSLQLSWQNLFASFTVEPV